MDKITRERGRFFASDQEIRWIGESLLDKTLPESNWTHEAHLAAVVYFFRVRSDIDVFRQIREIICAYNESLNMSDTNPSDYHETITRLFTTAIFQALERLPKTVSLVDATNSIIASPLGSKRFPLRFYSEELLFSAEARRQWVEPDVRPLPTLASFCVGRHFDSTKPNGLPPFLDVRT